MVDNDIVHVEKLAIPDVLLLTPKKFGDHRGFFAEVFNKRTLAEHGITQEFVQDNHSLSATVGTLRGLHLQKPPVSQGKLVRVIRGAVLDVAMDIRKSSPTFGQHVSATLSADNFAMIWVPPGFAHGFVTTAPDTQVIYKVTDYYSPENELGIDPFDSALAIDWGIAKANATLSGRDQQHPLFESFQSPF